MGSRPGHYNLAWYYPYLPGDLPNLHLTEDVVNAVPTPDELAGLLWAQQEYDAALQEHNTAADVPLTPAIIVFPSLCTPLVLYRDAEDFAAIELLVASRDPLTAEMVNRQLKVCAGGDSRKWFDARPLFGGGHRKKIEVTPAADDAGIWSTGTRFRGVIAPQVLSTLDDLGLTRWYRVRVDPSCLGPRQADFALTMEVPLPEGETGVVGLEVQDLLIARWLRALVEEGGPTPLAGGGLYCFARTGGDVDVCTPALDLPIQSHHPVFIYAQAQTNMEVGFASDIHVNSRLRILGRSTARVIEYEGADAAASPKVGDLVMETNRSFASVLDQMCEARPALVVLGGDFVDHLRNAYAPALMRRGSPAPTPAEVWRAVSMAGGDYSHARYPRYLDTTAFYSLVYHATTTHAVPFFALSGNHDAYDNAFGLSPRAGWLRTNETIPADLNLTMYEALLAFGDSAGVVLEAGSVVADGLSDAWAGGEGKFGGTYPLVTWLWTKLTSASDVGPMFNASRFEWFYATLTPFTDAALTLPHVGLVTLGWGGGEDMGSIAQEGQGATHLPRATESISPTQSDLLREATAGPNKVLLATHFTFVSYKEPLALPGSGTKHVASGEFTDCEMGTFEKLAGDALGMLVDGRISCVLSGHSHRRGLYRIDAPLADPATVHGVDIPAGGLDVASIEPPPNSILVVSDSAGPFPKRNVAGEFGGFGMDRPSGTLVQFERGTPTRVRPVFADRARPRAVVALDYCDICLGGVFTTAPYVAELEVTPIFDEGEPTNPFMPMQAARGGLYRLVIALSREATNAWGLRFTAVSLARWLEGEAPERFVFEPEADQTAWVFREPPGPRPLYPPLVPARSASWFLSLGISTSNAALARDYDWASVWHIEIEIQAAMDRGPFAHRLGRPLRFLPGLGPDIVWPEVPDFAWRARVMPEKYGGV
ncbi:MAG: metallophosphoesterase [Polyangiales bacterium]